MLATRTATSPLREFGYWRCGTLTRISVAWLPITTTSPYPSQATVCPNCLSLRPLLQCTLDRTGTNEQVICWLALFSREPSGTNNNPCPPKRLLVDKWNWISQVGCLRVHPAVALAAAAGGELLELSKALLSLDTGLCTLSHDPCLLPPPGPPWPWR